MTELTVQNTENISLGRYIKKTIALLVGVSIIAFGCSLAIKANIGVSAWDALGLTISNIIGIKVGDIYFIMNGSCILIQILIERKNFRKIEFLQVLNILTVSALINLFVYEIFPKWEMSTATIRIFSYELNLIAVLWLIAAYIIIAFGVSIVLESKLIRNPLEGVCLLITEKIGGEMGRFRQKIDFLFIAVTILLIIISKTPLTLREGTIICIVVYGPMLDVWTKPIRKIMEKCNV